MFAVNRIVVYPIHGVGKIVDRFTREFQGEKMDYLKVVFEKTQMDLSIPEDKAEDLGLRYPLSKKEAKKVLKGLDEKIKVTNKVLKKATEWAEERLKSGTLEDAVYVVALLRNVKDYAEREDKSFSMTKGKLLEKAVKFIRTEVEEVLGKSALEDYDLEVD